MKDKDVSKIVAIFLVCAFLLGIGVLAHVGGYLDGIGLVLLAAAGVMISGYLWNPEAADKFFKT